MSHTTPGARSLVDLGSYDNRGYHPGRGLAMRIAWFVTSWVVFEGGLVPLKRPKRWLLRLFGARMGRAVVIKTHVRIKYPWRLAVGDHCWIGQDVWIDNLADVSLGDHVGVSQGAYLCTGSHDHRKPTFDLIVKPIAVRTGAWVGARALPLGGVTVNEHAVVAAGSVVTRDVPARQIVAGNPARDVGERRGG